jgi:hypothetical protein
MDMELGVSRNRVILVFVNRILRECLDFREAMRWIEKLAQKVKYMLHQVYYFGDHDCDYE